MTGPDHKDHRPDTNMDAVEDAYRAMPAEEPPALVDQAVLNAARRAASGKADRPWNFGWVHVLSTAALIVVGVALVMQLPEAPGPEPLRVAKPPSGRLRDIEAEREPLQVPAPRQAADEAETAAELRAKAIEKQFRKAVEQIRRQEAEQDAAGMAAAPAADVAASLADEMPAEKAVVAEAAEMAAPPAPWREDPDTWLEQLERLLQAGDTAAFEAELALFRSTWPDHPLPEDWPD